MVSHSDSKIPTVAIMNDLQDRRPNRNSNTIWYFSAQVSSNEGTSSRKNSRLNTISIIKTRWFVSFSDTGSLRSSVREISFCCTIIQFQDPCDQKVNIDLNGLYLLSDQIRGEHGRTDSWWVIPLR